jgi:hypothetical protein
LGVALGAVGAFVWLFIEVVVEMGLEVAFGDESLPAVFKGAFVGSLFSL